MNLLTLSLANIKFRPLASLFNVMILALGIAIIVTLVNFGTQFEQRFTRDVEGIDLVVGAKGSPLQLILSSIFHLDIPTGNIPLEQAEALSQNRLVKSAIPIALGDNFNGFRIVGTTQEYITHYAGQLAAGRLYATPMEVIIGSEVAEKYALKLGENITGAHGLTNSDDLHSDFPYQIVGILKPSGSVLDRLVLTPIESVWRVHEHPDADDQEEIAYKREHPGKEVTAVLITYRTALAAATLPIAINKNSALQAASPAFELARLLKLAGVGSSTIQLFALLLIAIATLGFFITLLNAVNERRYDIALMRSLGLTRKKIMSCILLENAMLSAVGIISGIALGHVLLYGASWWLYTSRHIALAPLSFDTYELWNALLAFNLSILAGVIPAFLAYRINITDILAKHT